MKEIFEIIRSIETQKIHLNPTEIYNEGWMVRLLVHKSIEENKCINGIDFSKIVNWTSEGLISSPFIRAPKDREGYTHADIAVGDFKIDYQNRGEIMIADNASIFGIIEAKMKSNLSQGTKYAKDYNQASRNIACILSNTTSAMDTFFCVAAPNDYILKHELKDQIEIKNIYNQVEKRFSYYDDNFKKQNEANEILKRIKAFNCFTISYETWIDFFENDTKNILLDFYDKARKWNKL